MSAITNCATLKLAPVLNSLIPFISLTTFIRFGLKSSEPRISLLLANIGGDIESAACFKVNLLVSFKVSISGNAI